jgi:hypothetical protein
MSIVSVEDLPMSRNVSIATSSISPFRFLFLVLLGFHQTLFCRGMSTPEVVRQQRLPTLRKASSAGSAISAASAEDADAATKQRVRQMLQRTEEGSPFVDEEVQDICHSIQNLVPEEAPIDFVGLKQLLKSAAHLSHKNWAVTSENSDKLSAVLSVSSEGSDDDDNLSLTTHSKQLLERILNEGNWIAALKEAPAMGSTTERPWAVLVTGVNGIRKTTSMYQPWFGQLLLEALCVPAGLESSHRVVNLPTGINSFFRQLDHMICTLANEEFAKMYAWAASQLDSEDGIPSARIINDYSGYKAAIFARYRTLSELLGGLLLREAQKVNINCLMETSGKDVAMFHYIDHFFGGTNYNKLALHFTINDLECAKGSVDRRMVQEIQDGVKALKSEDYFDIIYANAGGPYGSQVLDDIQKDSDKVWETEVLSGNVGSDWYNATIAINAHETEPWTAQAVKPDGSLGTKFIFERR